MPPVFNFAPGCRPIFINHGGGSQGQGRRGSGDRGVRGGRGVGRGSGRGGHGGISKAARRRQMAEQRAVNTAMAAFNQPPPYPGTGFQPTFPVTTTQMPFPVTTPQIPFPVTTTQMPFPDSGFHPLNTGYNAAGIHDPVFGNSAVGIHAPLTSMGYGTSTPSVHLDTGFRTDYWPQFRTDYWNLAPVPAAGIEHQQLNLLPPPGVLADQNFFQSSPRIHNQYEDTRNPFRMGEGQGLDYTNDRIKQE